MKLSVILVVIGLFLVIAAATAQIIISLQIPTVGNVEATNGLTVQPDTIDWGTLTPSQTVNRQAALTNTGNTPLTLTMTHNSTVGTVTWDAENTLLQPNQSLLVSFSLTVAATASQGTFSFAITVNGS